MFRPFGTDINTTDCTLFLLAGEVLIQYSSPALSIEVLVNPQCTTVSAHVRNLLLAGGKHRHLLYAGHTIHGSGDWLLQDDRFTFEKFAEIAKSTDIENALKQQEGGSLDITVFAEGDWKEAHVAKQSFAKLLKVRVNPEEKLEEISGLLQFSAYLTFFVKVRSAKDLLLASDVVGNIRFSRPTLYIFPGSQGDSALFGISGFNLLVNGGYSRKSCFWDFTRHLDRIDAVVNTHLGADNFQGISAVLERKAADNVHPEIGFMYMNAVEKSKHSPNGDVLPENGGSHKPASLLVNLIEEGNRIVMNLRQLGQTPSPCVGHVSSSALDPITLYHKVGHGTLDMFVLNPMQDSKELKEFLSQWNKDVSNFTVSKSGLRGGNIPLPNMVSICALLVWKPSVHTEKITRILFPGSAPQTKIFEGLDKLKNMDIFQHESCSEKSLHVSKGTVKKSAAGGGSRSARAPTPKTTPAKGDVKRAVERKPKAEKGAKEETNNKKASEKKEKKSPRSSKSTTPASVTPSQSASEVSSPQHEKVVSPAEYPKEAWPEVKKEPAEVPVPEPEFISALGAIKAEAPPTPEAESESAQQAEQVAKPEADQLPAEPTPEAVSAPVLHSPEPLPDPTEFDKPSLATMAATDLLDEKVSAAPIETAPVEDPQSMDWLRSMDKEAPFQPGPPETTSDLMFEKEIPSAAAEVHAAPEPFLGFDEPKDEAREPEPVQFDPPQSVAEPSLGQLPPSETFPEPLISLQPEPIVAECVKESEQQPLSAMDDIEPDMSDEKKSLEDLGVYDDEKDVDTAELMSPAKEAGVGMSPESMEDLGIYDDEPESAEPLGTESTQSLDNLRELEQPEADRAGTNAAEAEDQQLVSAPADKTQDDVGASQHPEADQMVFGGAAPEGLPEPVQPVMEPEMTMEQDFLDQIQPSEVKLKDDDMPPVPEPETMEAMQQEQTPVTPEPEVEVAQEADLQASLKPEAVKPVSPEPEIEVAQEPAIEPEPMVKKSSTPITPEPESDMAFPGDAGHVAAEPGVELASEPSLETEPVPVIQQKTTPIEAEEAEVEFAREPEAVDPGHFLAAEQDQDVAAHSSEQAVEVAEEVPHSPGFDVSDDNKMVPAPEAVEQALEAAEAPEPAECRAYDERKIFPDEEPSEKPEEDQGGIPHRVPVDEAEEAEEAPKDLECRACDERKLFEDEPKEEPTVPSPQPKQVEDSYSDEDDYPDSPVESHELDDEFMVQPEKAVPVQSQPEVMTPEGYDLDLPESPVEAPDQVDIIPPYQSEPDVMARSAEGVPDIPSSEEEDDRLPSPAEAEKVAALQFESGILERPAEDMPDIVSKEDQMAHDKPCEQDIPEEDDLARRARPAELDTPPQDFHVDPLTPSPQQDFGMEQSLVEAREVTPELPQTAQIEELPSPSEPSVSEPLTATAVTPDEDAGPYIKEHDGDDDSLLQPHHDPEPLQSTDNTFQPPYNPFEIVDGPKQSGMSMSFYDDDDGMQQSTTNPFLGVSGDPVLQPESSTIPQAGSAGSPEQANNNPFDSPAVAQQTEALRHGETERDSLEREEEPFDPLKSWGQPMGLPAPAPPGGTATEKKAGEKKEGTSKKTSSATTKRADPKKATSGAAKSPTKRPPTSSHSATVDRLATSKKDLHKETSTPKKEPTKRKPTTKESPKKEATKPRNGPATADKIKNGTETKNVHAKMTVPPKKEPSKIKKAATPRPATAPAKVESTKAEPIKRDSAKKTTTARRPVTATTGAKAHTTKAPSHTPVVPFYVDLTYVPCHGDLHYVDLDFFRRIRARYYVISALNPSPGVLNALLEAKQTWENPEAEVTLIPTYDTETLRHWMGLHRDQLSTLKIDVAPSASRCTIQLQDHETSCAAYRLEF